MSSLIFQPQAKSGGYVDMRVSMPKWLYMTAQLSVLVQASTSELVGPLSIKPVKQRDSESSHLEIILLSPLDSWNAG